MSCIVSIYISLQKLVMKGCNEQEYEQNLNAKPRPYLERYRSENLKVHFKINI